MEWVTFMFIAFLSAYIGGYIYEIHAGLILGVILGALFAVFLKLDSIHKTLKEKSDKK